MNHLVDDRRTMTAKIATTAQTCSNSARALTCRKLANSQRVRLRFQNCALHKSITQDVMAGGQTIENAPMKLGCRMLLCNLKTLERDDLNRRHHDSRPLRCIVRCGNVKNDIQGGRPTMCEQPRYPRTSGHCLLYTSPSPRD